MRHLLVSREYPPSTYPRGGIGTYVEHIARLLAARGETVHVVAELWDRAPRPREVLQQGRLIVHRVPMGFPLPSQPPSPAADAAAARVLAAMGQSAFPAQGFAWQAALLMEALVQAEGIDVIEGQDYEAPLYYFLTRRALGLGPAARPPCVVHLHTAWEFVCQANDWGLASAYDVTLKRFEDHAIGAADAVLCPSEFLATQAERHYGLAPGSVERIPYPIGDTPFLERSADTWERGTICYFGRLEARKGVLEWLSAALDVAARRPGLRFEFIGADTSLTGGPQSSMRRTLEARIPAHLAAAFTFVDALPRPALLERLGGARLAVVPSRWENFPNTCVEAMCSGLPVLASPNGGMAEMLEDGRTGWLARSGRPADLADGLVRALDVPAAARAAMGRAASAAIRARCDNDATLDRQMAFRRRLAAAGAGRSLRMWPVPVWRPPAAADIGIDHSGECSVEGSVAARRTTRTAAAAGGLALVVLDTDDADDLDACLAAVAAQTAAPSGVAIVSGRPAAALAAWAGRPGWQVVVPAIPGAEAGRAAGVAAARAAGAPLGVAVVPAACRLAPDYVGACLSVLERHPDVGIVSCWSEEAAGLPVVQPHPALPYEWIAADAAPCLALRIDVLDAVAWAGEVAGGLPDFAVLCAPILAEGWLAVTWPGVLVRRARRLSEDAAALAGAMQARVQLAALARYGGRLAADAPLLVHLAQSTARAGGRAATDGHQVGRGALSLRSAWQLPLRERLALAGRALRNPGYAARWLGRQRAGWSGR